MRGFRTPDRMPEPAMATRPDKLKVIDEIWDDDRVGSFLHADPGDTGLDPDFFVLWKAYQGMRVGDFRRFLTLFTSAGHDLDAVNEQGETLATFIAPHRHAGDFIDALVAAGARAPDAARGQEA